MYRNTILIFVITVLLLSLPTAVQAAGAQNVLPGAVAQTGAIDQIQVLEDGTTIRTVIPAGIARAANPAGGGTNMLMQPSWLGGRLPGGLTFLKSVAVQVSYGVDKHELPEPAYFEITFAEPEIKRGLRILQWTKGEWKEIAHDTLSIRTRYLGDYVLATNLFPTSAGTGKSFILKDGTQVVVSIPKTALPDKTVKIEANAAVITKEQLPAPLPEGQNLVFVNAVNVAASLNGTPLEILPGDSLLSVSFARPGVTANLRIYSWNGSTWREAAYDKLQLVSIRPGTFLLATQK